jgi:hypothetical protein
LQNEEKDFLGEADVKVSETAKEEDEPDWRDESAVKRRQSVEEADHKNKKDDHGDQVLNAKPPGLRGK